MTLDVPPRYVPQDTGAIVARAPISARDWQLMHSAAALAAHGGRQIVPMLMSPIIPDSAISRGIVIAESGAPQRWSSATYSTEPGTDPATVEIDGIDISTSALISAVTSPPWGELRLATRTLTLDRGRTKEIPAMATIECVEESTAVSAQLSASYDLVRAGLPLRASVARELAAHAAVDVWGHRTYAIRLDWGAGDAPHKTLCALRDRSERVAAVGVVESGSGTWRLVSATSGPGPTVPTSQIATCYHDVGELDAPGAQTVTVEIMSGSVQFESVSVMEFFDDML